MENFEEDLAEAVEYLRDIVIAKTGYKPDSIGLVGVNILLDSYHRGIKSRGIVENNKHPNSIGIYTPNTNPRNYPEGVEKNNQGKHKTHTWGVTVKDVVNTYIENKFNRAVVSEKLDISLSTVRRRLRAGCLFIGKKNILDFTPEDIEQLDFIKMEDFKSLNK